VHLSFRILVLLIAASPAIIFLDNAVTWGLVAALTAAAIAMTAVNVGPAEAGYLSALFRPIAVVLAIPVIWMLVQLIPMPFGSLAHPIWASATTALNRPMFGRITIDPGATLLSISHYFCATGIIFAAAGVAIDRRRAEWMLFALVGAATIMGPLLLAYSLGGLATFGLTYDPARASVMSAVSVLGTIIAAAAAIRAFERFETRRLSRDMTQRKFWSDFAVWLAAWAISWFVISGRPSHVFAAACGTTSLVIVEVIRRLGVGRRASAAIAATAIVVAIAVIAFQPTGTNDVTLRFASSPLSSDLPMAEQMIMDTRWTGAGAGAFPALAPIYRDISDPEAPAAPTTAAAIAIELGRPAMVFVLAMMAASAIWLGIDALRRGRDSFYPAAAAGCIVALSIELFTDATLLSTTVQILSAAMIGLGLAQSKSRSRR
jgi:hypothetical protein